MAAPSAAGAPAWRRRCSGCRARTATSGRCARARSRRSTTSASPTSPTACRASCPTRSRSASRSRGRSSRDPRLMLLDEPAGGLGGDEMRRAGRAHPRPARRMAVLLVEHHMDLVMAVCDRVVVLDFGGSIADGTPGEVRADQRGARRLPGSRASMLQVDEARSRTAYGAGPRARRRLLRGRAGQHHRGPGRQRRRQDDPAAHVSGLVRPRAGRIRSRGATSAGCPSRRSSASAWPTCPRVAASSPSSGSRRTCGSAALWRGGGRARRPGRRVRDLPAAGRARARSRSTLSGGERQMLVIGRALMSSHGCCCSTSPRSGSRPRSPPRSWGSCATCARTRG